MLSIMRIKVVKKGFLDLVIYDFRLCAAGLNVDCYSSQRRGDAEKGWRELRVR